MNDEEEKEEEEEEERGRRGRRRGMRKKELRRGQSTRALFFEAVGAGSLYEESSKANT